VPALEGQELAEVDRCHVRRPPRTAQQRHLAEELAGPELDLGTVDRNHDRALGDEIGGARPVALADQALARRGRFCAEQEQQLFPRLVIELREYREAIDEVLYAQAALGLPRRQALPERRQLGLQDREP